MSPLFYLSSSFVFLAISFEAESSRSTLLPLPRLKTGLSRSCTSEGNLSSTVVALSGTGHRLYAPFMLQEISQEEACYSHCFSKFIKVNATVDKEYVLCESLNLQNSLLCHMTCLVHARNNLSSSLNRLFVNSVNSSVNCDSMCGNIDGDNLCQLVLGSCDVSFVSRCQNILCPQVCEETRNLVFKNTSSQPCNEQLHLEPVMDGEGYMRYNVTTGINLDTCNSENKTAFGVIWKIEFHNGSEFYIPQHFPLIEQALSTAVGRGWSQHYYLVLPFVQERNSYSLHYALVDPLGYRSNFTWLSSNFTSYDCKSSGLCYRPPENMSISIQFVKEGKYIIHTVTKITAKASPDHHLVGRYCLKTFSLAHSGEVPDNGNYGHLTHVSSREFDYENGSLHLRLGTLTEINELLPNWNENKTEILAVYAISGQQCANSRTVPQYASWLQLKLLVPCHDVVGDLKCIQYQNTTTGRDWFEFELNITSPPSALVPYKTLDYKILSNENFKCQGVKCICQTYLERRVYKYSSHTGTFPYGCSMYEGGLPPAAVPYIFAIEPNSKHVLIGKFPLWRTCSITVQLRKPTPVRNLTGVGEVLFESVLRVNLTWQRPLFLQGTSHYSIQIYDSEKEFSRDFIKYTNYFEENIFWSFNESVETFPLHSKYAVQVTAVSNWNRSQPVIANISVNLKATTDIGTGQDNSNIYAIFAILPILFILFLCIVMMVLYFRCKGKEVEVLNFDGEMKAKTMDYLEGDVWEMSPSYIILNECIGEGQFGEVYRATISGGDKEGGHEGSSLPQLVAVKILRDDSLAETRENFFKEIETMKSITKGDCPHVLRMVGCCTLEKPNALLMEYVRYGDLLRFLRHVKNVLKGDLETSSLSSPTRKPHKEIGNKDYVGLDQLSSFHMLSMMHQIAVGMKYLSEMDVIHRDLACRNILLGENMKVKISDFGMSKENGVYIKTTTGKLPLRWMSIESITERVFTTKSDVWSFGIVMWEIATLGCRPYPSVSNRSILPALMEGYRMEKQPNISDELYRVMLECWKADRHSRPTFNDMEHMTNNLLASSESDNHLEVKLILLEDEVPLASSSRTASSSSSGSYIGLSMIKEYFQETVTDNLISMLEIVDEEEEIEEGEGKQEGKREGEQGAEEGKQEGEEGEVGKCKQLGKQGDEVDSKQDEGKQEDKQESEQVLEKEEKDGGGKDIEVFETNEGQ